MAQAPRTRRQSKREAPEVKAARARVLLDDPNVRAVFDEARKELITVIERTVLDGSEAKDRAALEAVRQLQALNQVQRIILRPLVAERIAQKKADRKAGLN